MEAAKEIHVDSSLFSVEVERTKFLTKQRLKKKENADVTPLKDTGLLISRNFASGKKAQLAKMREIDDDVREFLALDSYFSRQDLQRRMSLVGSATDVMKSNESSSDLKFLLISYDFQKFIKNKTFCFNC